MNLFPDLYYGILSAASGFLRCMLSGTETNTLIVHRDVCSYGIYNVAGGDGKISVHTFGGRCGHPLLYVGKPQMCWMDCGYHWRNMYDRNELFRNAVCND